MIQTLLFYVIRLAHQRDAAVQVDKEGRRSSSGFGGIPYSVQLRGTIGECMSIGNWEETRLGQGSSFAHDHFGLGPLGPEKLRPKFRKTNPQPRFGQTGPIFALPN